MPLPEHQLSRFVRAKGPWHEIQHAGEERWTWCGIRTHWRETARELPAGIVLCVNCRRAQSDPVFARAQWDGRQDWTQADERVGAARQQNTHNTPQGEGVPG